MNKLIIAAVIIVGLGVAYLMLDYVLVYAQQFPTLPRLIPLVFLY
jgi:hypothetical protein